MVEFKCARYKNNRPFIKDAEIDDYALTVIKHYNPKMLVEVIPIDHLHFLEHCLGLDIIFTDIYYGKNEDPILGATSFNDGDRIEFFDRDNNCVGKIPLKRGSVVIDNSLDGANMERRQLFTGLHEGGHWLLHKQYYTRSPHEQISLFEEQGFKVACCRTTDIEPRARRELITDLDFIEHQANFCASALAMNKTIMWKTAPTVLSEIGLRGNRLFMKNKEHAEAKSEVVAYFSDLFNVSKQAAEIRLRKLGIIHDTSGGFLLDVQ